MYSYFMILMICYNFLKTKYFFRKRKKHKKSILWLFWYFNFQTICQVNWNNHDSFFLNNVFLVRIFLLRFRIIYSKSITSIFEFFLFCKFRCWKKIMIISVYLRNWFRRYVLRCMNKTMVLVEISYALVFWGGLAEAVQ